MRDKLFEQGLKLRKQVLGAAYVEKQLKNADAFTMPMQMLATKSAWGMVWSRPGLPRKIRSMLNIAMLVALGKAEELELHLGGAIRNGVTKKEIGERRRGAFVRNVYEFHSRHGVEQLAREVRRRAVPRGGEVDLARPCSCERDQLLHRPRRKRRMNDQHVGCGRGERDRREILDRIEGHFGEEARVDRERSRRAHQDRVTVGRGLGDDVGADIAARAGPVVDHHLLREAHGESLRDRARDDVGAAARGKGHDEADRLRGVGIGRRGRAQRRYRERSRQ